MSLWLIVPRDPLIFRDGKPFTAIPGERAKSLVFPYPSTIAGAVRTRVGTDAASGRFDATRIEELKQIRLYGPVLVELDKDEKIKEWFFPAPADALLIETDIDGEAMRYSLAPLVKPEGALTDLEGFELVGPAENIKDKPLKHPPRYWKWAQILEWLKIPSDGGVTLSDLGIRGPKEESRTHVSITAEKQTALPGALFQTSGMEYVRVELDKEKVVKDVHTLALAFETAAELDEGVDFLGGERRVVRWQKGDKEFPRIPPEVKEEIIEQGHCRLLLATPAYFDGGHLPASWLKSTYSLQVTIKAAAVPRYQTISGWDYERKEPKPTRRLVPAGSVYFLELTGDKTTREKFVSKTWMNPISDGDQFRRDGFGLALLGTWDGKMRETTIKEVRP